MLARKIEWIKLHSQGLFRQSRMIYAVYYRFGGTSPHNAKGDGWRERHGSLP